MYLILNKELEQVAEITTFASINWEEEYLSQSGGDFEIVLPSSVYSELGIEDGFFIYKTDSLKFGIINYVEFIDNTTENEEIQQLITLKGEMGESILKRRVLSFQLNKSGTLDDLVASVIYTHFTNPKDTNRQINLEYIKNNTFSDFVSRCITGCTVAELMESLCSICDCSYRIYLDLNNKKFKMKLIKGSDKSSNIVFSKREKNLSEFTLVKSKENYISHVFVGGEGNGNDRKTVTVTNSNQTGMNRIETYLDKKSLSSKDMDPITYINKLQEEGKTELSKYATVEASSFDLFLNNYEYIKDFDLGDKVKIINENLGIETVTRVLAALTSVDENGVQTVQITLGDIAEIELAEDETTIEKEEYTPEDTDENGEVIDNTWDTNVTQINTEYLKIYAELSDGVTLEDSEFAGGFFKIAENVYVMCIKNNSRKYISKIYYYADENILKSEDQIYGYTEQESIQCLSHRVDETSKHSYDCFLGDFCNITKIITIGEPVVEEIDGFELYEIAHFKYEKAMNLSAAMSLSYNDDNSGNISNLTVGRGLCAYPPVVDRNNGRYSVLANFISLNYYEQDVPTTYNNWAKNSYQMNMKPEQTDYEYSIYLKASLGNGNKINLRKISNGLDTIYMGFIPNSEYTIYAYAPKNKKPQVTLHMSESSSVKSFIESSDNLTSKEKKSSDGIYYIDAISKNHKTDQICSVTNPLKGTIWSINTYFDSITTLLNDINNNSSSATKKLSALKVAFPNLQTIIESAGSN